MTEATVIFLEYLCNAALILTNIFLAETWFVERLATYYLSLTSTGYSQMELEMTGVIP